MQIDLDEQEVHALIGVLSAVDALALAGELNDHHLRVIARQLRRTDPGVDDADDAQYVHRRTEALNQKLRDNLPT